MEGPEYQRFREGLLTSAPPPRHAATAGLRLEPLGLHFADIALASIATIAIAGEQSMNIQQHAGFYIAGLTARTITAHEMSGKGKSETSGRSFLQPNLVAKIPNKDGCRSHRRLHRLRDDHTGHYTYLLGLPILSAESLRQTFTVQTVPAGRYAVFSSSRDR